MQMCKITVIVHTINDENIDRNQTQNHDIALFCIPHAHYLYTDVLIVADCMLVRKSPERLVLTTAILAW